ncbi:hypothetical protein [Streptomyces sp. NPDC058751]|uniref:hypothetical protein n=1 Tax=Streptomyces sp. NPDC058751 TaxID=3346623 RepID=UPI0036741FE7
MRERLRSVGWAHAITVAGAGLAAVAAIGGLWAQAVATYWAQETAKDQLSQSREDSLREKQAQASQITFWSEDSEAGTGSEFHVLNRSLAPVMAVKVGAQARRSFKEPFYLGEWGTRELPPCTEVIFETRKMFLLAGAPGGDQGRVSFDSEKFGFEYLRFVDSHGLTWARWPTGLSDKEPGMVQEAVGGVEMGKPRVKKAEHCGDEHG